MSIFDFVRLYQNEWTEVDSRKFTPEECKVVQGVNVVASKYGKSVCFMFANGKRYIPLEPVANVAVGDILSTESLELVSLEYTGSNPSQKVTKVLRIRIPKEESTATTFDNPFGL